MHYLRKLKQVRKLKQYTISCECMCTNQTSGYISRKATHLKLKLVSSYLQSNWSNCLNKMPFSYANCPTSDQAAGPHTHVVSALDTGTMLVTISMNSFFIIALLKFPILQTQTNMLLGALCVSDLFVGLVCQPIFLTYLFTLAAEKNVSKTLESALSCTFWIGIGSSCVAISYLTLDRYTAICHPYLYRKYATTKNYLLSLFADVVIVAVLLTPSLVTQDENIADSVEFFYTSITLLIVILTNVRVYKVVSMHANRVVRIGTFVGDGNDSIIHVSKERKRTKSVVLLMVLWVACKIPFYVKVIYGLQSKEYNCSRQQIISTMDIYAKFFNCLLSCLDPFALILCCKRKRKVFKQLLCCENR